MAASGSYSLGPRLDFQQLMVEACHRWLRPAEICEILHNYQKFHITPEPPNRPPSGSLFLFDRKVLRYFRKDGHNWRKKKDGKTVKEAHEKLKVGSVDALHCYYAHGEENENFQRRSYWLLEPDFMHIVFVHYLEVKGNKTIIGGIRIEDEDSLYSKDSSSSSGVPRNYSETNSGNTDSRSPTSTLSSLCEDADSGDVHLARSRLQSSTEASNVKNNHLGSYEDRSRVNHSSRTQGDEYRNGADIIYSMESQGLLSSALKRDTCNQHTASVQANTSQTSNFSTEPLSAQAQSHWQITVEDHLLQLASWPEDQTLNSGFRYDSFPGLFEQNTGLSTSGSATDAVFMPFDQETGKPVPETADSQCEASSNLDHGFSSDGNCSLAFASRKLSFSDNGLQKADSFSRWVSKELGDVEDLDVHASSNLSWNTVECGTIHDESPLSPSLSQHQLFSITDFTPKWAYTDSDTEVFINGTFLSQPEVSKSMWSCMFGEVEVPAEILADGILCCHVPSHEVGRVPFYITCSNRLACSEVREFEYREGPAKQLVASDVYNSNRDELDLCSRFERLVSHKAIKPCYRTSDRMEIQDLIVKIMSLMEEDYHYQTLQPSAENLSSEHDLRDHLLQKIMKDKFCSWLVHKVTDDDQRPSILDAKGQGVIHLAAALGYYWAMEPIVLAGVSINFRDINGWTALHWAAYYGREQAVVVLLSLGAAPAALTDPSPEHPLSQTPADLASENGHKGISGFLAETSLTSYLSSLSIEDSNENASTQHSGSKAVLTVAEKAATPITYGDVPEALSLKDSLTAVCNAKQAADRIYQVFRMQSFQRKQLQLGNDGETLDEHALSLLAAKTRKPGQNARLANAAATKIQKKFRGWQKRKEFLIIRQRIIKVQAIVRGHQVRKQYKTIVWSVGILEKVILRWRRKGSGLRGFRQDSKEPNPQGVTSKDDDYDFLKEGRRQTEERFQKALTRVKSMVQYPEARDQYRRLLTVVEGIRENKACDMVLSSCEEAPDGELEAHYGDLEDMIDIGPLLDDDAFMSMAFE